MRRKSLLLLLLLAGCAKGPEADLQYIKEARSAGAEWALINEQASQRKLTDVYVSSMRNWLRHEIRSAASALSQRNSDYAREMQALLAEPNDAAPHELRSHVDKLKRQEDQLESA